MEEEREKYKICTDILKLHNLMYIFYFCLTFFIGQCYCEANRRQGEKEKKNSSVLFTLNITSTVGQTENLAWELSLRLGMVEYGWH